MKVRKDEGGRMKENQRHTPLTLSTPSFFILYPSSSNLFFHPSSFILHPFNLFRTGASLRLASGLRVQPDNQCRAISSACGFSSSEYGARASVRV
jgi:hypothetical protein